MNCSRSRTDIFSNRTEITQQNQRFSKNKINK
uniref:Uncharacterized protein n=1 Tax=Rhizophora mucronata TaxID=61149 RepID=A0A2P2R2D1_RHIMU